MKRTVVQDLALLLGQPGQSVRSVYDRAAPRYERFRKLWLDLAGAEAEAAMRRQLGAILAPRQRVLDAGAGTGAMSRVVLDLEPRAR